MPRREPQMLNPPTAQQRAHWNRRLRIPENPTPASAKAAAAQRSKRADITRRTRKK